MAWSIWKYLGKKKTNTIRLDNEIQVKIFLILYENPNGISRDLISDKLEIPRTTVFDNLCKLFSKSLNNIPYIKSYSKPTLLKGRPTILYYIPKGIRSRHIDFKIEN